MPSYLFCFILYFHEIIRKFFHKEKLLQFLVILVTLGIYSFLVLLLSDNFTLPCDHIPQVFFFSFFPPKFTENASGIVSQLKLLGAEGCSVSM